MSMLNKISVIGIILLLLVLFIYLYMQDVPLEVRPPLQPFQKLKGRLEKVKMGWKLYADGKYIYTLKGWDAGSPSSYNGAADSPVSMGIGRGNTIRIRGLDQVRLVLSQTRQHGILIKTYDNSRSIKDMAGNLATRMLVPYGKSRIMNIKGKRIEFRWFNEIEGPSGGGGGEHE